jgi:hypothetical protein
MAAKYWFVLGIGISETIFPAVWNLNSMHFDRKTEFAKRARGRSQRGRVQ